ncbi:MAG: hypothetical protein JWP91_4257 [Fibrobacteres bacterium]|nr:hypothetical protein [Fibrobacterota bacterium]
MIAFLICLAMLLPFRAAARSDAAVPALQASVSDRTGPPDAPNLRPDPQAPRRKVLIIGIDGMRPDALLSVETPNLKGLIRAGAFASSATADSITRSGPGWASVLTGVWHDKHHVYDNVIGTFHGDAYPAFFKRLKESRPDLFTACIVNWAPIRDRLMSGIDLALAPGNDDSVASRASSLLLRGDPDVLFLHFDAPDHAGHKYGFSRFSPPYRHAVASVDRQVGKVMEALQARPGLYREDWLILVTTDHGGSFRHHGRDIRAHRRVFLIVSGNDSMRGTRLSGVSLVDVAPTAMAFLGVPVDPGWGWEGKAVGLKDLPPETMQAEGRRQAGDAQQDGNGPQAGDVIIPAAALPVKTPVGG